ncbi:MAG: DinB family protein [Candidatus Acidiferrales bacterium]
MKFARKFSAVIVLAGLVVFALPAFAQRDEIPKSISGSVGGALSWAERGFLSVAEAMPESKYSYLPTGGNFEGVRSFGEQVKHVACAQFAFFNEIEAKTPPVGCEKGGPSTAKTKAELIQYVRDSFAYGDRVLATITPQNAVERVEGPYAGPNTKLGMAVTAVWHITDHYGQLVVYLRLNGIVPPVTQQYPLKVR